MTVSPAASIATSPTSAPSNVRIVTSCPAPPAVTLSAVKSPRSPLSTTSPSFVVTVVKVTLPPPVCAKLMSPTAVRFVRELTVTASLVMF